MPQKCLKNLPKLQKKKKKEPKKKKKIKEKKKINKRKKEIFFRYFFPIF